MTATGVDGAKVAGAGSVINIAGTFTGLALGQLCIAGVGWVDGAGTITCTVADSLGQAYTPIPLGKIRNATSTYATQLYYQVSGLASAATVTVTATYSTATTFRNLAIERYTSDRGPWTSDPFNKNAGTTGTGTALSSGNMTPDTPGQLIVGWGSHNSGTLTASGSFTARQGGGTDTMLEDFFQTVAATIAATETASASDLWTMIGASFRDAEGAGVAPQQLPLDLLMGQLARRGRWGGEIDSRTVGGSLYAAGFGTGTLAKRSVTTGTVAAAGMASGVAKKVTAQNGGVFGAGVATGVAKKVMARTGTVFGAAVGIGTAVKRAPVVGSVFGAAVPTGVAVKRAIGQGAVYAAAFANAASSGARAVVGRLFAAAYAAGVAVKRAPVVGSVAGAAVGTGTARKVAVGRGSVFGAAWARGAGVKRALGAGTVAAAAFATGMARHVASARGTVYGAAAVVGSALKRANVRGSVHAAPFIVGPLATPQFSTGPWPPDVSGGQGEAGSTSQPVDIARTPRGPNISSTPVGGSE